MSSCLSVKFEKWKLICIGRTEESVLKVIYFFLLSGGLEELIAKH